MSQETATAKATDKRLYVKLGLTGCLTCARTVKVGGPAVCDNCSSQAEHEAIYGPAQVLYVEDLAPRTPEETAERCDELKVAAGLGRVDEPVGSPDDWYLTREERGY